MAKNPFLQLQREEYEKLPDVVPSLLGYVETSNNSCIIIEECTVKNEAGLFVKNKREIIFVPVFF